MYQLTLQHPTTGDLVPLCGVAADDYYIIHVYGGLDTLTFDIQPQNPQYALLAEEGVIIYGDNDYVIKTIDGRSSKSTVSCNINLDFLKSTVHTAYDSGSVTLSALLAAMLPSGWIVIGADLVTIRRTINKEDCSNYDVVMQAIDTYKVCFEWHTRTHTVRVIKPENMQPAGKFFTDELNLRGINLKGSSSTFCTRLYAYGKPDEDGNPLTIASVNNGAEYVENLEYSNKVVAQIWRDERYTDAQSLKDDAIEKLKLLANPVRSYECDVIDISKQNDHYDYLQISMYSVFTLIDRNRNTRADHRVAEYKEYPEAPQLNVVTLSSVAAKITTKIDQVKIDLSGEIAVDRGKISELRQDADAITARVGETYTKGETDAQIGASVDIAKDVIRNEVSESYATNNDLNAVKTTMEQQSDQFEFRFTNINGELQNVSDALINNQELLEEYIRFKGALIELGKVGNKFTAELDNERLAFLENGVQIAYISNNKLYITDAEVSEHLAMGKTDRGFYDLYVRSNGHLTLKRRR